MISLFNYSTLNVELIFKTKSLQIQLNRPKQKNAFNLRMIKELDDLLTWCASHLEVQSIYIKGHKDYFSVGADIDELKELDSNKLNEYFESFQRIIFGMNHLPQTILIDASGECHNLASEFLLGADIRIARKSSNISFNHLHLGIPPKSGAISLLNNLIPKAMAKNWILSAKNICPQDLLSSGFIFNEYESKSSYMEILESIHKQAHLSRIQSKATFLEIDRENLNFALEVEKKFSQPSLKAKDWKNDKFVNPVEYFKLNERNSSSIN